MKGDQLARLVHAGVKLAEIRSVAEAGSGSLLLNADDCAALIDMVKLARCPDPKAHE